MNIDAQRMIAALAADSQARGVHLDAWHDDFDNSIHVDELARDRDDPATRGRGAEAMRALAKLADAIGASIHLSHSTDEPGLATYYAGLGYERDHGQSDADPTHNMTRHRRTTAG